MNPTNVINMNFKNFFDSMVQKEANENEIRGFLSANQFVMYFNFKDNQSKKTQLYGSKEDDRIAYSIMKHPRKDDPVDKYEYFGGINLEAAIKDPSNMQQRLFTKDDIKNVNIIEDVNTVIKKLTKTKHASPEMPAEKPEKELFIDKK